MKGELAARCVIMGAVLAAGLFCACAMGEVILREWRKRKRKQK